MFQVEHAGARLVEKVRILLRSTGSHDFFVYKCFARADRRIWRLESAVRRGVGGPFCNGENGNLAACAPCDGCFETENFSFRPSDAQIILQAYAISSATRCGPLCIGSRSCYQRDPYALFARASS